MKLSSNAEIHGSNQILLFSAWLWPGTMQTMLVSAHRHVSASVDTRGRYLTKRLLSNFLCFAIGGSRRRRGSMAHIALRWRNRRAHRSVQRRRALMHRREHDYLKRCTATNGLLG